MFDYVTVKEAAKKWGITPRRVQLLCVQGWCFPIQKPCSNNGQDKVTHPWIEK